MSGSDVRHAEILALIDTFVRGDDWPIAQANLIVALAMYCPGGGEFLYDKTRRNRLKLVVR